MNPLLIPALTTLLVTVPSTSVFRTDADLSSESVISVSALPSALKASKALAAARGVDATTGKPLPYCFRDKNDDNKCDKSVNAGGKCPRNCVRASSPPAAAAPTQAGTGCAGCGACQLG